MFSIKNLTNNDDKIKRKMSFVYERVFNMCKKEIIYRDKIGYKSYLFVPPSKITGEIDYELSECLRHVIGKLRKGDFTVFYKHPAKILIVWDGYEKYNQLIDNTRFLYNEDKKTNKFYNEFTQGNPSNITKILTTHSTQTQNKIIKTNRLTNNKTKRLTKKDIIFPKLKYCGN